MYGAPEYNDQGLPKCEICGLFFARVLTHVRQKHHVLEREYKKQFGFDLRKGICSQESAGKSREAVIRHWDTVVDSNLLKSGQQSRFKKGSKGRRKHMVSEQTRIMLRNRLKTEPMLSKLRESGARLGRSGLGNLKRWKKE